MLCCLIQAVPLGREETELKDVGSQGCHLRYFCSALKDLWSRIVQVPSMSSCKIFSIIVPAQLNSIHPEDPDGPYILAFYKALIIWMFPSTFVYSHDSSAEMQWFLESSLCYIIITTIFWISIFVYIFMCCYVFFLSFFFFLFL